MNSIAKKHTLLAMSVSVALGLSSTASALTAGPIVVTSNIGEPLNATIRLGGVRATDVHALTLNLASSAQYAARGVKWLPSHKNLRFRVVPVGAGQYAIAVSSTAPIQQPFIDFLLSIKTPTQDLVREYAAFPKVGVGGESLYNRTAAPPTSAPTPTAKPLLTQFPANAKVTGWQGKGVAKAETVAAAPVSTGSFHGSSYGPIKPGQTLYSIAMEVRPSDDYPMRSVMRAIFNANRHAFASSSLNSLKAGVTLTIPDFGKKNPEPVAAVKRPVHHVTHRTTPDEAPEAPTPSVAETPTVTPPVKTEAPKPEPKPVKVTQDDIATVFGKGSPANRPHPDLPVVAPAEENPKAAEQAEAAVKAATQAANAMTTPTAGTAEKMAQAASQNVSAAQTAAQKVVNNAQEATQTVVNSAQDATQKLAEGVQHEAQKAVETAKQTATQVVANAQNAAEKVGSLASNTLNAGQQSVQNAVSAVGQAASSAADDVQKAAAQVGEKAQAAVKNASDAAKQAVTGAQTAAHNLAKKVMPSVPKMAHPKAAPQEEASFLTDTLFLLPNWQWLAALLGLLVVGGGAGGFYAWKKKKSQAAISEMLSGEEPMLDEEQMAAVMAQIEGMDGKDASDEPQEDVDLGTEAPATQEHFDIENFLDEEEMAAHKDSDLDTDFFDDYEDEEVSTPAAPKAEAASSDEFDMGELEWEDVDNNAAKHDSGAESDDELFFDEEETVVPLKKTTPEPSAPKAAFESDDLFFEEPTASEVAAAKAKEQVATEVADEKVPEKGMDELFMDWTEVDFDKAQAQEDGKSLAAADSDLEDFDFDPAGEDKSTAFPEEVTQVMDTAAAPAEEELEAKPQAEESVKEKNSVIEEMEINLELASSFVITGHADRAKGWLEEVIAKGTPEQKKKAEDMLRSIK